MNAYLLFVSTFSLTVSLAGQGPVFVDAAAAGVNNGTSWANAYIDLSTALGATGSGEIWIAKGTYTPATRTSSFVLRSDVAIYGGFSGI